MFCVSILRGKLPPGGADDSTGTRSLGDYSVGLIRRMSTPHTLDLDGVRKMAGASPKAVRSRSRSPFRPSLIGAGSKIRPELDAQRRAGSKHRCFLPRLRSKLILAIAVVLVALVVFYWQGDGPKLVKRDVALAPGDRLKGGQYTSFCTSIIATGCKPKHLLLGRDGSLGLYEGSGPHARKVKKLWSADMSSKGNAQSEYDLVYTGDKIILNKDGKMKWMTPVKSLPKNLKPWPFGS